MKGRSSLLLVALLPGLLLAPGCAPGDVPGDAPDDSVELGWISGTPDERFAAVEDQFAGFSQTMFEVGRRYSDLYWAIEDENWPFALYQAEKIEAAIELGAIRRPGREASARRIFLDGPLPALHEALEMGEAGRVAAAFQNVTAACNQCHVAEEMAFVRIAPPMERTTVVAPPL